MNRATELAIKQRLEDKAERDPNVLRDHLDDQDALNATIAAFVMQNEPNWATKLSIAAQDTIERIWDNCLQEYIGANFQSELAEFVQEMDDAEREAKRDALMGAQ